MIELRDYQAEDLELIEKADAAGVRRPLVCHPTGAGKTVLFSHMIARRPGRSLVLVHRDELVNQTVSKLELIAPELTVGVVKAARNESAAQVVVASVQTASRDRRLADLGGFSTVIVDEAHHAVAPTWRKVLRHVGSFGGDGPLTVGFTATPQRDKGGIGEVWDEVVAYRSIRELIFAGYLSPVEGQTVQTSADFRQVVVTRGDFSEEQLGDELTRSGAIDEIAQAYVAHASGRRGLAFTPTVATAQALASALVRRGITAEAVWGNQPLDQRKAILRRLRTGRTQVVTNCAILTEGFDEPSVDCIVVARPTRSHGLYIQMVGRGTRLFPGKASCLVLDVVGATERHDLVALIDLGLDFRATRKEKEDGEAPPDLGLACELCHRPVGPSNRLPTRHDNCTASGTARRDVFAASKLRWLPVPGCDVGEAFCLPTDKGVIVMRPLDADEERWQLAEYVSGKVEVLHAALPAEWAQGIGEDRVKAYSKLTRRDANWLALPPTDPQRARLLREGLPADKLPRVRTRGDAADLLTRLQGRRALRRLERVQC
jgi:superfamily II DNA or RNA helicase